MAHQWASLIGSWILGLKQGLGGMERRWQGWGGLGVKQYWLLSQSGGKCLQNLLSPLPGPIRKIQQKPHETLCPRHHTEKDKNEGPGLDVQICEGTCLARGPGALPAPPFRNPKALAVNQACCRNSSFSLGACQVRAFEIASGQAWKITRRFWTRNGLFSHILDSYGDKPVTQLLYHIVVRANLINKAGGQIGTTESLGVGGGESYFRQGKAKEAL